MPELTPLMSQYQHIKKDLNDTILFFRLGDFYEMFGDDAKKSSKILEITLTSRHKVPMCGIPYHSSGKYISRLIKAGQKVAICEQTGDPKTSKNIVKREVVRIITPGTVLEENILDAKQNNFLAAVYKSDDKSPVLGMACADMSTGDFLATEFNSANALNNLESELARLSVAEVLLSNSAESDNQLTGLLKKLNLPFNYCDDWHFVHENANTVLKEHFQLKSLKGLGFEKNTAAVSAAGAILTYMKETQKSSLPHLQPPKLFMTADRMILDETTIRNLELISNLNDGSRKGSLLGIIDLTVTSPGARMMRRTILHPFVKIKEIKDRQDKVTFFFQDSIRREKIRSLLKNIFDMERLAGRLNCGTANARDLNSLSRSFSVVREIKDELREKSPVSGLIEKMGSLESLVKLIETSIVPEPPVTITEGGIIKPEYNPELNKLYQSTTGGKEWITRLQEQERKRTGINSLKVGYTNVFGYYIELTRTKLKQVPDDYIRKQTLVNSERFITPELKEQESLILGAEEKKKQLEYEIFQNIRSEIMKETSIIQETSKAVSELDVLCALAETAAINNYIRPEVNDGDIIQIKEGRHPVVENMLSGGDFVPNDTLLDENENQVLIITGPNMAGKSTYIRQVAISVLLAQMGSYVPAEEAVIGVSERIFTRIGTVDNISRGESTFMVEMMEVANILNNTTEKSLLILDEVGRGTSTFDGISIAWAVIEYLTGSRFPEAGPRTLFATHYFELTDLSRTIMRIKNYNFSVKEWNDNIVFLRKLVQGSADKSYGIHVAKLAGLPKTVIRRAEEILDNLQDNSYREDGIPKLAGSKDGVKQLNLFYEHDPVFSELENIEPENMTPLEALNKLNELKNSVKKKSRK